ncbi:hypothetical protein [Streptomyces smyrnaeus]|uniref:hypothetical protein n=1 Tax=Streptomyces smyrnaeus TaxID=1387713 RepID=UPI00340DB6C1
MTGLVHGLASVVVAAVAIWCAVDTNRHARRAKTAARRAQAAHRETVASRARVELAALKAERIRRNR